MTDDIEVFADAELLEGWEFRAVLVERGPGAVVRHECRNAAATDGDWYAMTAADVVNACHFLDTRTDGEPGVGVDAVGPDAAERAQLAQQQMVEAWLCDVARPKLRDLSEDKATEWLALISAGVSAGDDHRVIMSKVAAAIMLDLVGFADPAMDYTPAPPRDPDNAVTALATALEDFKNSPYRGEWNQRLSVSMGDVRDLLVVINESHKLLVHYGDLLNAYDNGRRDVMASPAAWLDRILQCKSEGNA